MNATSTPARMLPLDIARCRPLQQPCDRHERCARCSAPLARANSHRWVPVVDASICLTAGPCPMFIDGRSLGLLTRDDIPVATA